VFNKPGAMGKVIDAATMLGRTTGHLPILVAQYVILARLYVSIDRKHKNRIPDLISAMISTLFLILCLSTDLPYCLCYT
jgi:hypothetical protein